MCNINRDAEMALLNMGLNLITKAIEASVKAEAPITDVLATATTAYQQGKITKTQFMAVINALDEQAYQTRAYAGANPNDEYLEVNKFLNQYR